MEFFELLWGTVLLRPYVFVFLACYLTIATWNMGIRRAVLFTVLAYGIAFLSEYSSTRNGFPYGFYSYIDTTRDRELWIANVPFMDSLSYSFLSYVSYTLSLLLWSPLTRRGWDVQIVPCRDVRHSLRVVMTGAFLFMMLDVVIDPVAFLGDRWFLGQIYTYQEAGEYFNIPLTNFAGWFLVGTAILFSFTRLDAWLERREFRDSGMRPVKAKALLGPGVYFGVLAFNLAVTFYIGETLLGLCGVGWTLALLAWPAAKIVKATAGPPPSAVVGE
ncbi:MAG: carotenoid biosynthesis protein [Nitrospinaceae bacterium]|nr:carotenoid biosynthesis protein [Nitrospinaceae bacterium]NIR54100.1 carotenoid biosynthesis protein [Nitrospinaceae bacterium]NIS84518.1 carotenoid biosynthesis protein [Nitrospinaceae bacterium]NIT81313.1 carotenoid biosynthesis protein [Nitrospinaceae bacterium]NIU43600.1 carotenoid biosynthesis protein [Nitrospinaceae bacterium]